MTTTVTVKTHDWPAAVSLEQSLDHRAPNSRSNGWSSLTTFVGKDSEQTFSVTDTCSVVVRELPKEATSLDHADELRNMNTSEPLPS